VPKTTSKQEVAELIANIARTLVDHPTRVSIEEISDPPGSILRLKVDSEDIGNIVGTERRTERWLRKILGEISVKLGHRYCLEILGHSDRLLE
jgi:predicted RNA-binding protein YlqC (UPF0109 family)